MLRTHKPSGRDDIFFIHAITIKELGLPESAGDIVAGQLMPGVSKDLSGFSHLDQIAEMEVGGALGYARGLLHGVGNDDDGVVLPEFVDQLFDPGRGDGVQRGARLIHQDYLGPDRNGARDTKALLLATGERGAGLGQSVLYFFPKPGFFQARLHDLLGGRLVGRHAVNARRIDDIVENGFREGIGFLEYHADPRPHLDHIHGSGVDVFAIEPDFPADAATIDGVVHPVQGTQEGRFATTGRTDDGGDLGRPDIERHILDGSFCPEVHIKIADRHARGLGIYLSHRRPRVSLGDPLVR